jgi:hypothetical protein
MEEWYLRKVIMCWTCSSDSKARNAYAVLLGKTFLKQALGQQRTKLGIILK